MCTLMPLCKALRSNGYKDEGAHEDEDGYVDENGREDDDDDGCKGENADGRKYENGCEDEDAYTDEDGHDCEYSYSLRTPYPNLLVPVPGFAS